MDWFDNNFQGSVALQLTIKVAAKGLHFSISVQKESWNSFEGAYGLDNVVIFGLKFLNSLHSISAPDLGPRVKRNQKLSNF